MIIPDKSSTYQLVELANDIFQRIPGPHVTFIDPRKHNDTRAMMEDAYRLHRLFRLQGVPKENIVISVCIIQSTRKSNALLICSGFTDPGHRGRHIGGPKTAEKSSGCQLVSRKQFIARECMRRDESSRYINSCW